MQSAGLSQSKADELLRKYGLNEIKNKEIPDIIKFFKKFNTPVSWLLELTMIFTFILHRYPDAIAIFMLLIFNAVISFWNEKRAQNALTVLKKHLSLVAHVYRDNNL